MNDRQDTLAESFIPALLVAVLVAVMWVAGNGLMAVSHRIWPPHPATFSPAQQRQLDESVERTLAKLGVQPTPSQDFSTP